MNDGHDNGISEVHGTVRHENTDIPAVLKASCEDGLDEGQKRMNAAAREIFNDPLIKLSMAQSAAATAFGEMRRLRKAMELAIENGAADEMRGILEAALNHGK